MKLIFCGNLHCGGGVQVATSFIQEAVKIGKLNDFDLIISSIVSKELKKLSVDLSAFNHVYIIDFYGFKKNNKFIMKKERYSTCFVIFGPIYYSLNAKKYIVGFAQPWIAYNRNDVYKKIHIIEKIKYKLIFFIKDIIFRRYTELIVEHQHVKNALIKKGYKSNIQVVSNTYASIFNEKNQWSILCRPIAMENSRITLGYIGKAYTHKNLEILKKVNDILINKYNITINFLFTLDSDDMKRLKFIEEKNFFSVGTISLNKCPSFYKLIDALIFPTMLECFSASPIEAMKMNVPILTSNYSFMKEICQDTAIYFDATSSEDIAKKIAYFIENKENITLDSRDAAKEILATLPTSKERAINYLKIINRN
ncbi:glycosyltransferase [Providencia rettgeri]|nr:glycosyltransferase [Providencia rettgeri]